MVTCPTCPICKTPVALSYDDEAAIRLLERGELDAYCGLHDSFRVSRKEQTQLLGLFRKKYLTTRPDLISALASS